MLLFISSYGQSLYRWEVDYGATINGGLTVDSIYAETLYVSVCDTFGAYTDTLEKNALYDSLSMWISGQDTFGAVATTDTVVINGITEYSPFIITIYTDDVTKIYNVSVWAVANTLFVCRSESDTSKSDIYNYIGRK